MNVNLINDIINDYTKLYNELYKKNYSSLNDLLDKSKKDLNSLKEEILSVKEISLIKIDFLSEKNKNFILCIKHSLNNKLYKYIFDFLNILKKFIQYKLWTKNNSHETINLMKEISDYPKNGIECQNKVIEVLQTLLFASFFDLNQNDIINIYLINIKVFNNTNNYQNSDFKNPIRLLFITLTDIVYKSNNNELITKITKFIFSLYIKDDENNNDNEYLELLKDFKNNIYIKCLSLELLSQGLKIIKLNQINNNHFDEIINTKIVFVIKTNLDQIKKQQKNNNQQYIHLLKLCRISMILINNIIIDYDIIESIISFLKEDSTLSWIKKISMECLEEILNSSSLLINIYNHNKEILTNIFSILSSIYEKMDNDISYLNQNNRLKNKKQIEKNQIFLQGDENSMIKQNESNDLINNIKECLNNLINSFSSMMNEYKLSIDKINLNLTKEQEIIKEIVVSSSINIKKILFNLIEKEFKISDYDSGSFQKTLIYIQNIIILYSSLNILDIRDEYLELICKLCIIFDNNKNLIICSSLLNISKFTSFFNEKSFVTIFHTIEAIHIKYNYNKNEKNKNIDLIIKDIFQSYQKFFSPLDNNENDNSREIEFKNEKLEKQNLLCSAINTMFIDSKSMNTLSLKYIIGALFECLKITLNNENEIEKNEKEEIIIFHLTKILTITLLNIENIFILFDDYLIPIINLLIEKKILLNFTVNLVCSIIKEILINHNKIIENIKQKGENLDNNWWINEKYQIKLFSPLNSFTDHNLIKLTNNRLYICLSTIIQQSGNYIDLFGWESILKICQILINYNIEEIFLIIKLILNDYDAYLTIFNVIPIITLLGAFISYQKDRNICFNSIELFWSCANIVEKYHKGKIIIDESRKKIFEDLLKEKKIENFDIFYNGLYYKIFSQLLRINSDFRTDIRRSAIKVFTEIFVSKINSIDNENSFKIINDIFFNTFLLNSQKFIDSEKNKIIIKEDEENNNITVKENELEQTLHASLLSMIKILKSMCISEKNIENENIENIFISFLKQLGEIIIYGTIPLNIDILHGLSELKNAKNNNKLILPSNLDVYFEIMNKTKEYINSPRFKLSSYNKMKCIKFLNEIINTLNSIFCNELSYKISSLPLNEIFSKIFQILDFLFSSNFIIENKSIESLPQRITEIESQIFCFIENIPIINEKYIYDFIIIYCNFDINNYHTGALAKRAIDCLTNIINKSNNISFILNENGKDYLIQIFEKLYLLFQSMNNQTIIENYINNNGKNREDIFIDFTNLICKLFFGVIVGIEKNNEEILKEIINYSKMIYDKCINEIKLINDEKYLNKIIEIYGKIIENLIYFLFIDVLPFIYVVLNEKKNEIENLEKELLKMLCFGHCKDNKEKKILYKNINEMLNKIFIDCLFIICKYQTNEEILNYIKKINLINNINEKIYIKNFINFKKKCTNLLIKKLNNSLKEYKMESENESIKIEDLTLKIKSIFINIKNLEVFPDLANNIESNNENINLMKNRKVHILYLYNNIVDFILIDNKDIKLLIKDILLLAFNGIQLPSLENISFEEK